MNLFVYGTLLFPQITEALTGRQLRSTTATLGEYLVTSIPGRPYPGLVPQKESVASGLVLFDIDDQLLRIFDAWEGDEYERRPVILDDLKAIGAMAYIWKEHVTDVGVWNPYEFRTAQLSFYLEDKIPRFLSSFSQTSDQPV